MHEQIEHGQEEIEEKKKELPPLAKEVEEKKKMVKMIEEE